MVVVATTFNLPVSPAGEFAPPQAANIRLKIANKNIIFFISNLLIENTFHLPEKILPS